MPKLKFNHKSKLFNLVMALPFVAGLWLGASACTVKCGANITVDLGNGATATCYLQTVTCGPNCTNCTCNYGGCVPGHAPLLS